MLLRSMRKGFFSAIFLGLLVLGGVSLVFTDWNGMFKGGFNKTDVAKVDGTPIKVAEFNSRVSHILRSQQISPSDAYQSGLINNILSNEIFDILVKKDAAKMGIRVADSIIAEQIKTMIAPYKANNGNDKDALKQFLEIQGMNEKQLVAALRDDMTSKILKATIVSASYVPQSLAEGVQAYQGLSKDVEVVFFSNNSASLKKQPTDADLKAYYQNRSESYMNPEHRDITLAILDTSKIAKPKISDEDIKTAYEENQDNFAIPASVDVDQSLVSDESKAKEIAEQVKSGKSLSDAVKAVTGDTKAYLGKNNFSKDGLKEEIATPVFAAKSGDVVGPVKSAFGFHVIKVLEKVDAHTEPLDAVKDKIRKELEDEKSGNAVFEVTSAIEDRLANGETYEVLQKDYPLTLTTLKGLNKETPLVKNEKWSDKDAEAISAKIFTIAENAPSELSDISGDRLFSVRVDKINAAAPKAFEDVKADILKNWTLENQMQENLMAAQKKIDDLKSGKLKFSDLKPQTILGLTRKGNDKLAKDAADRFIAADKGQYIMAMSKDKNGIYIGRVTEVKIPVDAKVDDASIQKLKADLADASYTSYMESLQNKYTVSVNDNLLKRVYGSSESNNP